MPKTEMIVNYVSGQECRIAIVRDDRLEEFYQERASAESHVGNIYKGRVVNVEPSIQAAFVDFGLERNGFLHVSDLHPMYFPGKDREEFEQVGSKTPHRERPPIQKCLRRGQEILVQVLKEGIGTKGPTLTSYLSIPGRFIVMMPHMQRLGVTRKIEDDDTRREARKLLAELNPPEGFGFIVRTAGIGQTKTDLKRDLAYLQRLWKNIEARRKRIGKVGELYTESDLVIRTIRDVFSSEIDRIVIDDLSAARRAHDFLTVASPRSRSKILYYNDPVPLFHRFNIESQIDQIHAREVPLPSGGSLVIDQTEALVAVDVNSGKSREARDAESNAFNTNKEAVDEICRQLRLRDLGGVIVLDLIDMRDRKNRRTVEQRFRGAIRHDRARTRTGSISQFGILELTRQRMRPSLKSSIFSECAHCAGAGYVKSAESVVLDVMRRLALALQHDQVARVDLTISPDVAFQLLNRERAKLSELEQRYGKQVTVRVGGHSIDYLHLQAYDERGSAADLEALSRPGKLRAETEASYRELARAEADVEVEVDADDELADETMEAEGDLVAAGVEDDDAGEAATTQQAEESEPEGEAQGGEAGESEAGRSRRRRRRRGRGGRNRGERRTDDGGAEPARDAEPTPGEPEPATAGAVSQESENLLL
ncbi:MAG: Rne/Rng family ribonuclease, partial [Phycisphaeraceae bacterium]